MKKMMFASAASFVVAASPAFAQDAAPAGLYGQLNVGLTSLDDLDLTFLDVDGAGTDVGASGGTKNTVEFGGALGYDFGLVRAEVEVAYSRARNNSLELKTVNGAAVPTNSVQAIVDQGIDTELIDLTNATNVNVSGNKVSYAGGPKLRRLSGMANVWFDIPLGESGFSPYVGGGIGVQGSEIQGEGKATFAWQLGAGVAIPVSDRFAITADYRHREQNGYTLSDAGVDYARVGKAKSNSFQIGIRAYF